MVAFSLHRERENESQYIFVCQMLLAYLDGKTIEQNSNLYRKYVLFVRLSDDESKMIYRSYRFVFPQIINKLTLFFYFCFSTYRFSQVCPQRLPNLSNETAALDRMPRGRLEYLKRLMPHLQNQSEDCLYLNIYVPIQGKPHFYPANLESN